MELSKEIHGMLDLMMRPGFCVENHKIIYTNQAAQSLLLYPGADVQSLLLTGQEEYAHFQEGCLYLQLNIVPGGCGASVFAMDGQHIFLLDQESDDDALRALALAAQQLREPLTGMQLSLQQLSGQGQDREQLARLNRAIHQMLRIIGNMSDAGRCADTARLELRDIPKIFDNIFEQAMQRSAQAGMSLQWENHADSVSGLVDETLLERAVLNILSNSIKFSPSGSTIQAQLTRHDRTLKLSITDGSSGIAEGLRQTLFRRYLRQPGIEDGRFGLGLGMVLIRSAAERHGGTVLIDQPTGTRVTMTLTIRQDTSTLRSPILRVDYAGEQDHGLVELSDCLPLDAYTGF
ncbi:MAG: ATP-binding protein [Oscillospiraceae bacterium]|nr:ATP-binding protein [Oscillospiraceae bacterium]